MENTRKDNRRNFLKTTGKTVTFSALAMSFFSDNPILAGSDLDELYRYDFMIARVKFPCNPLARAKWNILPGAEKNIFKALSSTVRCKVKLPPGCNNRNPLHGSEYHFNYIVDLTDLKELRKHSFLLMTSDGNYALTDEQKKNFKAYIDSGGFILMDDCVDGTYGDHFFKCSIKLIEELYGQGSIKKIPIDHEVFHNIYDFDKGMPHIVGSDHPAMGLFLEDRLAVFLSATDLHCASSKLWDMEKYNKAISMIINIVMYAISH